MEEEIRLYYARWNNAICKEYEDETVLWRYLTLNKFLKLLKQNGIYFRRMDKLDDTSEGIPIGKYFDSFLKDVENNCGLEYRNNIVNKFKKARENTYVSCWNQKNEESYLLWKCYSNIETGIAIKTRYSKIKKFFQDFKENKPLFFCEINYNDTLFDLSEWSIAFTKRKIFSEENEFRIVYQPENNTDDGVIINGNIKELIEKIYLAPKMESELKDIIIDKLIKNGMGEEIIEKSEIYKE